MTRKQIFSGKQRPTIRTLLRDMEKVEEPVLNAALFLMRVKEGKTDKALELLKSCPAMIPNVIEATSKQKMDFQYAINELLADALCSKDQTAVCLINELLKALRSDDRRIVRIALNVLTDASDPFLEGKEPIGVNPEFIPLVVEKLTDRKIKMEALLLLDYAAYTGTDVSQYIRWIALATTVRSNEEREGEDAYFDKVSSILCSAISKNTTNAMDPIRNMLSSKRETDVILALRTIASAVSANVVYFDDFRVDYNQLFADKRVRIRCETAKLIRSLAENKIIIADAIPHLKDMFLHPKETLQDVCELDQTRAAAEALDAIGKNETMQQVVRDFAAGVLASAQHYDYTVFWATRMICHEPMYEDVSWVSPQALSRIVLGMFDHTTAKKAGDILVWIGTGRPEMVAQIQKIVDESSSQELVKKMEPVFERIKATNKE